MKKLTLAVMATFGAVCAQAQAAVYTQVTNVAANEGDGANSSTLVFVPNFNASLGTLINTTVTLAGSATQTLIFYQNTPPTTGVFINTVQFNGAPLVSLGSVQVTPALVLGNTLQETFAVNASAMFSPTYTGTNPMLDLTFSISGNLQSACCANSNLRVFGTLTTAYQYIPVPEPISVSLLLVPMLGIAALRRRT